MKTVCITIEGDIPDTELTKEATITVGENTYKGDVVAILTHVIVGPAETAVTLKAPGLKVEPTE